MRKILLVALVILVINPGTANPRSRVLRLKHGDTTIYSIRFMPDGKRFASASFNGTVVMWDVKSGKRVWYLDLDEKTNSPDRRTISHIFDMEVSARGHALAISYDQSSVTGGTAQAEHVRRVALVDANAGQIMRTLTGVEALAFSPGDDSLLWLSSDQTVRLWDMDTGQTIRQIKLRAGAATLVFSPDGTRFAIATAPVWGLPSERPQPIVGLYDAQTGQLLREFPRDYSEVMGIAFNPAGRYLLIGGFNMPQVSTKLWDLSRPDSNESRTILRDVKGLTGPYAYSPDGKLLAYVRRDRIQYVLGVRDLSRNREIVVFKLDSKAKSLVFAPDGTRLLVGTEKGQIVLVPI